MFGQKVSEADRGVILQPAHSFVEHLGEVECQDVVQEQLSPRHHSNLLGQSVDVPDQDLQPDVDGRVEDEVEHHRPTLEASLLTINFLQHKVCQCMRDAEVHGGKAQQFRVPIITKPVQRRQQDVQGHAVHPVEVEPHPSRQPKLRLCGVRGFPGPFLTARWLCVQATGSVS